MSIVLHLRAMREVGTARQAVFFATAPFIGAVASVPLLGDRFSLRELVAGALMAAGLALVLRARHAHAHAHEGLQHAHAHDEHHGHDHAGPVSEPHSHPHTHATLVHDHPHLPDVHHRHGH